LRSNFFDPLPARLDEQRLSFECSPEGHACRKHPSRRVELNWRNLNELYNSGTLAAETKQSGFSQISHASIRTIWTFALFMEACSFILSATRTPSHFQKILESRPKAEPASLGLFHSLGKLGRGKEAIKELRRFFSVAASKEEYRRLLEDVSKAILVDELVKWLEALKPAQVRRQAESVKPLLGHRSALVRWAIAQALGRAGIAGRELLARLRRERNTLVITEITESLAILGEKRSLPQLHSLAKEHRSPRVRSYAILAITDLEGRLAVPFLLERRARERNGRVKATLDCALFAKGAKGALPNLLEDLKSKKPRVLNLVVNLLYYYAPRRSRTLLLAALRDALARETLPGVRGDIERAILRLSKPAHRIRPEADDDFC
jgi:HEAT repeat protein